MGNTFSLSLLFHVRHSQSYCVALLSLELAYAEHAGLQKIHKDPPASILSLECWN